MGWEESAAASNQSPFYWKLMKLTIDAPFMVIQINSERLFFKGQEVNFLDCKVNKLSTFDISENSDNANNANFCWICNLEVI